ncbi:MerR family transcriptional regulator [Streptomyces sp. NPDC087903]|uniref:MerR family transcriptional regulator n=1 Tax=Streptomyces sp. NPDC087903 TaxID=3365819 RepID=UPI003830AAC3
MRIGELATRAGTTRDTIRFYERVGLVEGRRLPNGYRDFPPETVPWLHYVRTAQTLGFSLAEIARHGEELREAPDPADALSALFAEKIQVVDARIAELAELRADLTARVGTGCPLRASDRPARENKAPWRRDGDARTLGTDRFEDHAD